VVYRYGYAPIRIASYSLTDKRATAGNVSKVCPGFHATYRIPTPGHAANHTPGFTEGAATDEAHQLTILTSKGMAGTAWKVLTDARFAGDVKASFERGKGSPVDA
jgi:hypothetical protein